MAIGSLLHILDGMVVLNQSWYNSSTGGGSLVLMDVAESASKVRCGWHHCIWLFGVYV